MLEVNLKIIEEGVKFQLTIVDKVKFGLQFEDIHQVKDYLVGKGYNTKILAESDAKIGMGIGIYQCKYYAVVRRKQ